jgi:hypothetical protein
VEEEEEGRVEVEGPARGYPGFLKRFAKLWRTWSGTAAVVCWLGSKYLGVKEM